MASGPVAPVAQIRHGVVPLLFDSESMMNGELARWATWMKAANDSPDTINLRLYHIRRVLRETSVDAWAMTTEDMISWLGSKAWKPNTTRSYRSSLVVFYTWAQGVGHRRDNPALLIPGVRVPRGLPRPTPENVYRTSAAQATKRVRMMIHLAAVCGLRRGEISRGRREDVVPDLLGWSLRVIGKGGHVRMVPLPDEFALELLRLPAGWFFPSMARPGPLTPAHVGKLVSRALPDRWTCHTLRHRCGTVAYAGSKDLRAVQELLGHARTDTTALYTKVAEQSIRAAMEAAAADAA
jgi:integrase